MLASTHPSIVLLTPTAALIGLAFLLPLAAFVLRERRSAAVRRTLGIEPPPPGRRALRPLLLVVVAALVAGTAAQPAVRTTRSARMRSDAQIYFIFDVTRSMLASAAAKRPDRFDRARAIAQRIHLALADVPSGVATITNRMMPLLFPSDDTRAVPAVVDHSLEIMQPPPLHMSTDRLTDLGSLELVADRAYFDRKASRHALVLLSDLDSDSFSLSGTLALLHRHRIEPFAIRVARPGERIYDSSGEAEPYNPVSSLSVRGLRAAHWHAYEETSVRRALRDLRAYLGTGPERSRGSTETQRNLAAFVALGALLVVTGICAPSLNAGLAGFRGAPREKRRRLALRRRARGDLH